MEEREWELKFTHFQAHARGFLVRKEIICVRLEFEDIVKEIDGQADHLHWIDGVISTPHFTDTDPGSRILQMLGNSHMTGRPNTGASCLKQLAEQRGLVHHLSGPIEPERDGSHSQEQVPLWRAASNSPAGDGETESSLGEQGEAGLLESAADTTTVWSSLGLDGNYGHFQKSSLRHCVTQDVPHKPDALRLHRNTLAMELLWLQQAIGSRKKYLMLKERLSES